MFIDEPAPSIAGREDAAAGMMVVLADGAVAAERARRG